MSTQTEAPPPPTIRAQRLTSLDACRGAIMLLMASSGLGIPQIASKFPDNAFWGWLGRQCEHAPWAGCTLWDLIQPAFMFMVGVALPWSTANRLARGDSLSRQFAHALWRGLLLVLFGVFLTSAWSTRTEWQFTNVLCQIGLGYPFLFLIQWTRPWTQWTLGFALLVAYWAAFALHPLPSPQFDWATVGVPANWPFLKGFEAHWEKNSNFAASFDVWFLNQFPREKPFAYSAGGYPTLNFVPSLVTMIFGLRTGTLLRSELAMSSKLKRLVLAGLAGIAVGYAIGALGWCPVVKRIWTPSWTLYSGGWVTLILAGFVAVVDGRGWSRWTFPWVVAGLNPIALYFLWQLTGGFFRQTLKTHMGQGIFGILGDTWAPMLERLSVLVCFWCILAWMHRRKLYLRV